MPEVNKWVSECCCYTHSVTDYWRCTDLGFQGNDRWNDQVSHRQGSAGGSEDLCVRGEPGTFGRDQEGAGGTKRGVEGPSR